MARPTMARRPKATIARKTKKPFVFGFIEEEPPTGEGVPISSKESQPHECQQQKTAMGQNILKTWSALGRPSRNNGMRRFESLYGNV
jgi:hypothetical protein